MLWPYLKHEDSTLFLALPVHEPIADALSHSPRLKFAFEVEVRNSSATIIQQATCGFEPSAMRGFFGPLHIFR